MRGWLIRLASLATALAVVVAAVAASAETFPLQIKRLEAVSGRTTGPSSDSMFRTVSSQNVRAQTGTGAAFGSAPGGEAEFAKVVSKEPASYNSKSPFRGVVTLGTQQFGFVLDSDKPAPEAASNQKVASAEHYNRLYFDRNHNGDLTDDPVIEADSPGATHSSPAFSYVQYSFPRVDLTVPVEGTKVDYSFFFSVTAQAQQQFRYASASLRAAAYREGEITLDGNRLRIVVTDFNSNGRFDDLSIVDGLTIGSGGTVYPRQGDMIYVDPKSEEAPYRYGYDATMNDEQHPLSKVLHIGGRFYDVSITPAGDALTLKPSSLPVGYVNNDNRGYRALVYGDQGILKVCGGESGRVPLPVGSWKLLMYTIDDTGTGDQVGEEPTLLRTLADAVLRRDDVPARPKYTLASARARSDYAVVEVREGETSELPFGPPYAPRVSGSRLQPDGRVALNMSLVGVAGEVCSNMVLGGARPAKPAFTITDPDGNVVERGTFEYG